MHAIPSTSISFTNTLMLLVPGVLILENNKTYGKYKDKSLYKCRLHKPDSRLYKPDSRLHSRLYKPDSLKGNDVVLVPYRHKTVGFSKNFTNLFVVVDGSNGSNGSDRSSNAKIGRIHLVIGTVTELSNFYEYSLWCRNLKISDKALAKEAYTKCKALSALPAMTPISNDDATLQPVGDAKMQPITEAISIDPVGCKDIDDAFGYTEIGPMTNGPTIGPTIVLSIYIANVVQILDLLDLWEHLTDRVSTIYLPESRINMLPEILSENYCSLLAGTVRRVLCCETVVINGTIQSINFKATTVRLKRNYSYDEIDAKKTIDPMYNHVKTLVEQLNKNRQYLSEITNSHDVIAWLMIHMNYEASKLLCRSQTGIFRCVTTASPVTLASPVPLASPANKEIQNFLIGWNSSAGQYTQHAGRHDILNLDTYTHITSPIRRLVDILNSIEVQRLTNDLNSSKAQAFYQHWRSRLDNINQQMKAIKKVQVECTFLHYTTLHPETVQGSVFDGWICEKESKGDKFYYTVYLPELRLVGLYRAAPHTQFRNRTELDTHRSYKWKIYHFVSENSFKQKIRLDLASQET